MWKGVEARLEENEKEDPTPLRGQLFDVFKNSGLRPGRGVTKKMVSFEFGVDERLLWEIEHPARNVFLSKKWQSLVEDKGFATEPRPFKPGMKDGGRHSALSRDWAFPDADCFVLRVDEPHALSGLLGPLLHSDATLTLDPAAVTRWIERLRHFFPALERFDTPDAYFDEQERNYKLEIASELKASVSQAGSDQQLAEAIYAALAKSNLLPWRAYWPMSSKGDADRQRLWPALRMLIDAALGAPDAHASALEAFVKEWVEASPQNKPDPARQIAEFLFLHLAPEHGIYIRYSVREDLWREAVGSRFPVHESMADTYRDELRFMQAVRQAFEANGLAPRDMIDVQSALWVVHDYQNAEENLPFSRQAIESAMDAYDSYRQSGKHSDIFDAFGDPRDYWVRSTKARANRAYPSKPIVGFLRKKTVLNGGWGQKNDAAAELHNSGYIIVDSSDAAVSPPESSDHLIRDADRIRLCARNYHVDPAREQRATQVSIRSGDLAREMGLRDASPAICSALGSIKFQQSADVPAPTYTEPNPSSSTVFTYQLAVQESAKSMSFEPNSGPPTATNLILYGPPGTGKTYATALEAVRLCLGEAAAAPFGKDRNALMAEYRHLVSDGRIEFVTFHQSFSYEDFVEGLRPSTGNEKDDEEANAGGSIGFSLEPHSGVFKTISERARLDTGNSTVKRLDRSKRIYKIALGRRGIQEAQIKEGLENSFIHLGWGGDIDWGDERFDDFQEIKKEWNEKKDPDASGKDANIEMTYAFRSGLQVGDYVVVSDGRDTYRAFGQVTGEYYYDADANFHPHRRSVRWIWRNDDGMDRASFYPNNFRQQATYLLVADRIDWDALESIVIGPSSERPITGARPHVLIIDEINRANISKVFGELITLLEVDKRLGCENEIRVRLPYSGMSFGVPANLHIIGTMNTADRSIALLDTALRRRFKFRELMPDPEELRTALAAKGLDADNLDGINLCQLMRTINERIEYLFDREHQIGHAYFTSCRTRADVEDTMRYKVIPLLAEYFYEDWSKVAAVLGDGANGYRFLEAKSLRAPSNFADDELGGEKLRWSVRSQFDFTEFST